MRGERMIPKGPLGMFGIAQSQLERIGYNPLEASDPMGEPMSGGGGGGGFGFSFGGQRPMNDMERTIAAHNYPGGFKVATDQYAAKYSDQLDEAALLELKDKYPEGPASGGTWDDFAANRQNKINNYYSGPNAGALWGPNGLTGNKANDAAKVTSVINSKGGYTGVSKPAKVLQGYTGGPLKSSNPASRDRSGLANRVVNYGSGGSSSRGGRRGSRVGRSVVKNSNPSRGFRRYGL